MKMMLVPPCITFFIATSTPFFFTHLADNVTPYICNHIDTLLTDLPRKITLKQCHIII